jgi:hypothetical protein
MALSGQDAISDYYIIGYYATNTAKNGHFRRVKVTLTQNLEAKLELSRGLLRRQGVQQVHHRRQRAPA